MTQLEHLQREGLRAPKSLISWEYLEMQRELHARPEGYGGKGRKWADTVLALVAELNASSLLDYGCGQGSLARALLARQLEGVRIAEYDPAIPGKDSPPSFADLVTVTDVLEHVEPARLSAVLEHLRILARKAVFFVVALDEANKTLLDGRNAHLILESPEWWAATITAAGFQLQDAAVLQRLPFPLAYFDPAKRSKRWIAVGVPC